MLTYEKLCIFIRVYFCGITCSCIGYFKVIIRWRYVWPVPRKVCQKHTENLSHSSIVLPCTTCIDVNITFSKGTLLYSMVSTHSDCSKHLTLPPLADLFIPTPSQTSLGSIQPYCNYCTKTSFTYPPFVARYSFIQLSELWQCGVDRIAKVSKWQQEDSDPGSLK